MRVAEGSPILNLEQTMLLDDGTPVEWGDTMLGAGHTIVGMVRQNADTKFAFEGERLWYRGLPDMPAQQTCPPNKGIKKQKSSCPCDGL